MTEAFLFSFFWLFYEIQVEKSILVFTYELDTLHSSLSNVIIAASIAVPLSFFCFIFISFDCSIRSDAVLPCPVLLTTIVAVVVAFMLILENQNTEQQHELAGETIHGDDGSNYSWYVAFQRLPRSTWIASSMLTCPVH